MPALPLARKECKTPDNTLCGGPEMNYVESHYSVLYFGIFVNSKLENTVEFKVNSIWQNIIDPIVIHISTEHEAISRSIRNSHVVLYYCLLST